MADRKKLSGAAYKKIRRQKEKELIKLKGALRKYFNSGDGDAGPSNEVTDNATTPESTGPESTPKDPVDVTTISTSEMEEVGNPTQSTQSQDDDLSTIPQSQLAEESDSQDQETEPKVDINFNDPGTWPTSLSDEDRCFFTKMRATSDFMPDISKSTRDGRTLTNDWFFKMLQNGKRVKRSYLAYSETKVSLYCVPCRLFAHLHSHDASISSLAKEEGFIKWKKLYEKIPKHENSSSHKRFFGMWKSLELSLIKGAGIDKELQDAIQKEETHWREVLYCIIDVILHLAKQGSPFRGSSERSDFENPNSGKFLNTIALVSHYNAPLREHIERHKKGQVSYFSSEIQDEFLEIISNKVRQSIIEDVKEAKYFALMFDCTPDISKHEQMTEVIRYVKINDEPEVVESFLDFFVVSDKTGEGLFKEILKKVNNDGLDIKLCRGQSYDNGANMAGKYKGVQALLLEENKYAYFVPCSAHSLNLVGVHAADACLPAQNYFGVLHSLYNYFSSSTSRWEVLENYVPQTLKLESQTRWSARLDSVEVVYKHTSNICRALEELSTDGSTQETKTDARSLIGQIKVFKFIIFTSFWFNVLQMIDRVHKFLQRKNVTVDKAVRNIKGLINALFSKRETLVPDAITSATTVAEKIGIEAKFKEERKRKKKRMPGELCEDEGFNLTTEEKFSISLKEILDNILAEMNKRFTALQDIDSKFGFLSVLSINETDCNDLKRQAQTLAESHPEDLNKEELISEVESFKFHALELDNNLKHAAPASTFKIIHDQRLQEGYPNLTTALQLFLTLPVSVASGERTFSKLKLIKNSLRNRMKQQRLTNISLISIERQRASSISFDEIIKTFAAKKSRKIHFI